MSKLEGILRYLLIIRRLQRGDYPTKDQLIKFVNSELSAHIDTSNKEYSTRTFERDLKDIRESLDISIQYKKSGTVRGYYISEVKDEVADPYNIETILEPFYILNSIQADTGLQKVVYPEKHYPKGLEHLYPLIKAAKEHCKVQFDYTKYHLAQPETREVDPYALKQARGRWYLMGFDSCKDDGILKSFGLDRIGGLIVHQNKYKPKDIDINEKFANSFGIMTYYHLPVEDIVLEFDAMDGHYLKSVPLHHSQQVIEDTPSKFVISVRLRITHDFLMEIISRGFSLKVISPPHLKEQVKGIFENAIKNNS
jgi:Predicted transcriptional regulator